MFYDQLKRFEAGQVLLDVYALTKPRAIEDAKEVKIAKIVLITKLVTSKWGDDKLHFRHRDVQRDFRYWPRKWRRHHKDVKIDDDEENTWGEEVPEGVWPASEEEAKTFYMDQIQ